eukprot:TRINITY_DN5757_c0_g1_i5.p1 TRINITY_DN5757_c0_g1~~TRINITY_DN5757_c0_g1_i5.p1  ORF type:complete len:138 (-),score=9.81 TRINITY_DN5757_c0_g1_i5:1101-1514(-)
MPLPQVVGLSMINLLLQLRRLMRNWFRFPIFFYLIGHSSVYVWLGRGRYQNYRNLGFLNCGLCYSVFIGVPFAFSHFEFSHFEPGAADSSNHHSKSGIPSLGNLFFFFVASNSLLSFSCLRLMMLCDFIYDWLGPHN